MGEWTRTLSPREQTTFRAETTPVWERWELEKAMELYKKYDVYVVSDEIWSDLMMNGHKHIPTQSVSEDARQRTAAFYAPSKTFSLAGLIGSYHIVYNKWWPFPAPSAPRPFRRGCGDCT